MVLIGGIPAPILYASQTLITAQVPQGLTGSSATVQVQNGSGSTATWTVPLATPPTAQRLPGPDRDYIEKPLNNRRSDIHWPASSSGGWKTWEFAYPTMASRVAIELPANRTRCQVFAGA